MSQTIRLEPQRPTPGHASYLGQQNSTTDAVVVRFRMHMAERRRERAETAPEAAPKSPLPGCCSAVSAWPGQRSACSAALLRVLCFPLRGPVRRERYRWLRLLGSCWEMISRASASGLRSLSRPSYASRLSSSIARIRAAELSDRGRPQAQRQVVDPDVQLGADLAPAQYQPEYSDSGHQARILPHVGTHRDSSKYIDWKNREQPANSLQAKCVSWVMTGSELVAVPDFRSCTTFATGC